MIKSFRGRLDDAAHETIRLSTNDGMTGYKIKKFELMPIDPIDKTQTSVVQIFTVPQTGVPSNDINFSDSTLLAAGFVENSNNTNYFGGHIVIFDNTVVNQDIFLAHQSAGYAVNYYLELEQVKLDLNEATVATLKDMRGSN